MSNTRTTTHLDWKDFLSFLKYCKANDEMFIYWYAAIATYCGLRMSDVLKLKWGDVTKEMIVLKEQKTGKIRKIPVHVELAEIIIKDRPTDVDDNAFIFIGARSGQVVSKRYVNAKLQRVFALSGIKVKGGISTHLFRKTFGRRIISMQKDKDWGILLLMEIYNHSSPAITKKYLGLRQEEINNAYSMM